MQQNYLWRISLQARQTLVSPSLSYYQLLGVSKRGTEGHIRKQYEQLCAIWSPEACSSWADQDELPVCEKIFDEITNGFVILTNKLARKEYDEQLAKNNTSNPDNVELKKQWTYLKFKNQLIVKKSQLVGKVVEANVQLPKIPFEIPRELLFWILSYLAPIDLIQFARVCRNTRFWMYQISLQRYCDFINEKFPQQPNYVPLSIEKLRRGWTLRERDLGILLNVRTDLKSVMVRQLMPTFREEIFNKEKNAFFNNPYLRDLVITALLSEDSTQVDGQTLLCLLGLPPKKLEDLHDPSSICLYELIYTEVSTPRELKLSAHVHALFHEFVTTKSLKGYDPAAITQRTLYLNPKACREFCLQLYIDAESIINILHKLAAAKLSYNLDYVYAFGSLMRQRLVKLSTKCFEEIWKSTEGFLNFFELEEHELQDNDFDTLALQLNYLSDQDTIRYLNMLIVWPAIVRAALQVKPYDLLQKIEAVNALNYSGKDRILSVLIQYNLAPVHALIVYKMVHRESRMLNNKGEAIATSWSHRELNYDLIKFLYVANKGDQQQKIFDYLVAPERTVRDIEEALDCLLNLDDEGLNLLRQSLVTFEELRSIPGKASQFSLLIKLLSKNEITRSLVIRLLNWSKKGAMIYNFTQFLSVNKINASPAEVVEFVLSSNSTQLNSKACASLVRKIGIKNFNFCYTLKIDDKTVIAIVEEVGIFNSLSLGLEKLIVTAFEENRTNELINEVRLFLLKNNIGKRKQPDFITQMTSENLKKVKESESLGGAEIKPNHS